MGGAREPVAESGSCPACRHNVSIPNFLSVILLSYFGRFVDNFSRVSTLSASRILP